MAPWTLTLCVFLPTLGAGVLLLIPRRAGAAVFRWGTIAALTGSLACAVWAATVVYGPAPAGKVATASGAGSTAPTTAGLTRARAAKAWSEYPLVHKAAWVPVFHIDYHLAADAVSMPLVLMTAGLSLLGVLAAHPVREHVKSWCILFLLLTTGTLGCFLAVDFFLFYVFFEMMLVPMYFLIGLWGGPRRSYAAIKFFLYTLLGSVLILAAMLAVAFHSDDPTARFDLTRLPQQAAGWSLGFQTAVFVLLFVGFAVKLPVVPFHTWLPDAHVEAPTPVSMVLAGVLLKMGGYGLYRIAWPLCPDAAATDAAISAVMVLGAVNIVYGGLVALGQTDAKRLVACSSISHMGFVLLGLGSLTAAGFAGGLFQMVGHGVYSAAMFLAVGILYDRTGHRDLDRWGGLARRMPKFTLFACTAFFAAMGLPGLCGFPGEALSLLGAFQTRPIAAGVAVLGVVLAGAYVLWAVQRIFLGRPAVGPGATLAAPATAVVGGGTAVPPQTTGAGTSGGSPQTDPDDHHDDEPEPPVTVNDARPTDLLVLAVLAGAAVVLGLLPNLVLGPAAERLGQLMRLMGH